MLGKHAPGRIGCVLFACDYHAVLAQAEGGRIIESCSRGIHRHYLLLLEAIPFSHREEDILAANRVDILLNRLFIEPAIGNGYPREEFKFLDKLEMHNKTWKYTERMRFDFDFVGLQIIFRCDQVQPADTNCNGFGSKSSQANVPITSMGWEINADSFYRMLKNSALIKRERYSGY